MIGEELAAFLQEGIAIHIGTRNQHLEPSGVRATAVRVDDPQHITVFVPKVASSHYLPNLHANGQAAVVFVRPMDDRSCQVKGVFEQARAATPRERPIVTAQWEGFLAKLEQIGIPGYVLDKWAVWPSIAVRLKVTALFDQTPGPMAGRPL